MATITVYVVAERCQIHGDDTYTYIEVFRTKAEAHAHRDHIVIEGGDADVTEYILGADGHTTKNNAK